MFFLGGLGTEASGGRILQAQFPRSLVQRGLEFAVLIWGDSWLQSAPGENVGPARLACRPATAIQWVHEHLFHGIGAPSPGRGRCGFCVTGNSGGAAQAAYALSFYGLANMIDAVILSGGPPYAALAKGCLGDLGYAYTTDEAGIIDLSYGYPNGGGPCQRHDRGFTGRWDRDSVDIGGSDYKYPKTRVVFIFGSNDPTPGPAHGKLYLAQLRAHHSPIVSEQTVQGLQHSIEIDPQGQAVLEQALLGG